MATNYWKTYTEAVYTQRNAALAAIVNIQTAIGDVIANPQPSYAISGPGGSESVDKAGMLAQLNNSLEVQQDILDRCQKLILQFPYQFVSRGV